MRHRLKRFKINNNIKNKLYSLLINKKIILNKKDLLNVNHYFYKIKKSLKRNNKYKNIYINFIKKNIYTKILNNKIFLKKKKIGIKRGDYSSLYILKLFISL
ncbi:hypothetical protein ACWNYQ_00800 [Candidatus Vidania fulgoroideorum]